MREALRLKDYSSAMRVPIHRGSTTRSYFLSYPGECQSTSCVARAQGGADSYRLLVQAALHWCDKFMVVISERSVSNAWVQAEVEWALERSRPIIAVRLDRCGWDDLINVLKQTSMLLVDRIVPCFDFTADLESAQNQLAISLDELLAKFPRRRGG